MNETGYMCYYSEHLVMLSCCAAKVSKCCSVLLLSWSMLRCYSHPHWHRSCAAQVGSVWSAAHAQTLQMLPAKHTPHNDV